MIMGTEWPVYHQVTRLGSGKWVVSFGICNGTAQDSQRFRTKREAIEAVEADLLAMLAPEEDKPEERILVEFTPGVRGWFEPVEFLSDEIAIIEWTQPGAGRVRGCVTRLDTTNGAGDFIWQWDGTFKPVEEAAS